MSATTTRPGGFRSRSRNDNKGYDAANDNNNNNNVWYPPERTYGVGWYGRHPQDPHYDPHYDDPHHYDWGGCDMATVLFVVFIFAILGVFIASWWWSPRYYYTHTDAPAAMPDAAMASMSGQGGGLIPGLGMVDTITTHGHDSATQALTCPPASIWNATIRLCQPKKHYPNAMLGALIDRQTHMCDSFYKHACGNWLVWQDAHDLPSRGGYADRSFSYLYKHNQWLLDTIVQRAVGNTPIDRFYHACVGALVKHKYTQRATAYQNEVMQDTLGALRDMRALPMVLGRLVARGFVSPITLGIEKHPTKPMMVPFWGHDGFGTDLSIESVQRLFETRNPRAMAARKARDFMELHTLIEENRPDDARVMGRTMRQYMRYLSSVDYEHDMVSMQQVLVMMQDGHNEWSLSRFFSGLDYVGFSEGVQSFPRLHPAWVRDPRFYRWFFGMVGPIQLGGHAANSRIRRWRAYVEFSVLYGTHDFAPRLEHNAYYHTRPLQRQAHWTHGVRAPKRAMPLFSSSSSRTVGAGTRSGTGASVDVTQLQCARITQDALAGLVAKQFLAKTYASSQETHDRVYELVENIRNRFVTLINQTWWLTDRDRPRVMEKLQAMIIRVAQPHHWHVEPFGDAMRLDDYWRNMDYVRRYRVQRNWDKWDADLDRAHQLHRDDIQRFGGALSSINAYYAPQTNVITVYTGILQHPFYFPKYNNASLYAIIGSVVGHEMVHALDPAGRLFDKDGSFHVNSWWDMDSNHEYNRHVSVIVHEYGNYTAALDAECSHNTGQDPPHLVDEQYGALTITEDMADIVGTRLAYEAYFLDQPDGRASDIGVKQHFFYAYAQIWCTKSDIEHECHRIYNDVHPIPRIRVDAALRHSVYFAQAFSCTSATPMGVEAHANPFGKALDAYDPHKIKLQK